jgi:1-deoxy-D-xylulose-5-phosphate reductoisomerase
MTHGQTEQVTILGSTGSIGGAALDVLARHPARFRVYALSASTQIERLLEQCRQFRPQKAVLLDATAAGRLRDALRADGIATEVLTGAEGLQQIATDPQAAIVVAAIVGAAGLLPTLAAVRAGKRVLFANKEPLVMCGRLFVEEAARSGAVLLPVDSEHNAIFQCMPHGYTTGRRAAVRRISLTCSGGPFRNTSARELAAVTPEQACAHPTWSMGPKISVDSATLMNKGLEVIEACWLFGIAPEKIDVVVHPQSIIHSMVEYDDGSVLAQMSRPDMRVPIAHALAWPERIESGVAPLDLIALARLEFSEPDRQRFPCLDLAYAAARRGGTAPAVLNAANEIAVQAFLDRRIGFTDIPRIIEPALQLARAVEPTLENVLADDAQARAIADEQVRLVATRGSTPTTLKRVS